jgi:hypothetical protein
MTRASSNLFWRPLSPPSAHSPARVVEQATGREIGWINRYLDREYVRRLGDKTLRIYAYNLLHFVRWWDSIHHTGKVREADLTEATLRDYLCFQSSQQPRPSGSTINDRIAIADGALATSSPTLPARSLAAFIKPSCSAGPWASAGRGWPSAGCA